MVRRTIYMYDATGILNVAWDGIALEAAPFEKMEKSVFLFFVIVLKQQPEMKFAFGGFYY